MHIEDEIELSAPIADVWQAISDPAAHARWHPFVTAIDGAHALGERRSCAVQVGGKRGETTEVCVEDEPERALIWRIEDDTSGFARMVADWSSGFRVEPRAGATRVIAESTFVPRSLLARLGAPLIRRRFHQVQRAILAGLERELDAPAAASAARGSTA
jgi:carbon monoxide dehydrogenase subunit G